MHQKLLTVKTKGRGFYDITQDLTAFVNAKKISVGLCQLFIQHTSASLIITENADPTVKQDLNSFMLKIAPDGASLYQHDLEGDDDMPAHIRSALTTSALTIPIVNGQLGLGTWQGVYCWEHRFSSHNRCIVITLA